ncbi:unnamed protein product [Symbiodinium sp. CCMP2592]|nr:unnamed protein product [Symbiodinium sp. CCMP2592]
MASRIAHTSAAGVATWGLCRLLNPRRRKSCLCEPVASAPTCQKRPLRVLSQNVWNSFFAGGPERKARLMAFREELERLRVDVVIVQEMFVLGLGPLCLQGDAEDAGQLLLQLGFVHQTSPTASRPLLGQSSGLVVYSKYPIKKEKHEVFESRRSVTAKGWLEVVIVLGSADGSEAKQLKQLLLFARELTIFNTHLEHSHHPSWVCVRQDQCRQLAKRAREVLAEESASSTAYAMVVGDFNVCSNEFGQQLDGSAEFQALQVAMQSAGFPAELPQWFDAERPGTLRPAPDGKLRCTPDHMFVTCKLKDCCVSSSVADTRDRNGLEVSDHLGLIAEFVIPL